MSFSFSDLGKNIANFAPVLGGAIAGPGGAAIGSLIANLFGSKSQDPQDIWESINADNDAKLKLLQFQAQHEIELQKLALQQIQLDNEDVANARNKQIELAKAGAKDNTVTILTYLIVIGFYLTMGGVFYLLVNPGDIAPEEGKLFYMFAGILTMAFADTYKFHLGHSKIFENLKLQTNTWKDPG